MRAVGAVQLLHGLRSFFKPSLRGDRLRLREPTIGACCLLLASVLLAAPREGRALGSTGGRDLSLGATLRSYALSGVAEAEAGYGVVVWGNPATPFYGFIHPRLGASSAASYNALDGALEVFPVAFLGVRAGGEAIQNDHKYSPYDCVLYRCQGRFYRAYFESELTLGAGDFFVQGRWRRERWTEPDSQLGDFIDPTSGFYLKAKGSSQTVYYGVAGWNVNSTWAVLAALRYAEAEPRQLSRLPFASVRYRNQGFSLALGAGTFESSLKKRDVSIVGLLRWEIWPSVTLH